MEWDGSEVVAMNVRNDGGPLRAAPHRENPSEGVVVSLIAVEQSQISRLADAIQEKVGHQRYQVWFQNSAHFDLKQDTLEISVPNEFVGEWITKHFTCLIQDAAVDTLGTRPAVRVHVDTSRFESRGSNGNMHGTNAYIARTSTSVPARTTSSAVPSSRIDRYVPEKATAVRPVNFAAPAPASVAPAPRVKPPVMAEVPAVAPAPAPTSNNAATNNGKARLRHELSSFIVGPSNQLAFDAAKYVSEYPGGQYNPLFIHGNCGLGKTHLLQGLCRRFSEMHPTKKWMYMTGEEFTNEFLFALRNNRVDSFRRKLRELDLLVIDDVHFLSGKRATQEEFLHTFNAIEAMGRQVVMASDAHPKMIEEFGESLINRFVSGMVVRIDPPNFNTRCEILRAMSLRNRINFSEEVIQWVAKRVTQNVRELEGAVTRMSAHTRLTGRPADLTLAQDALGDLDKQLAALVKPESVLSSVCTYFGLEMRELMSGRRQRTISLARSVAMYLVRKTSRLSFPEIAIKMGKRNHSTVISACRRIERAAAKNELLAWSSHVGQREEEVSELLQRLEEQARATA